MNSNVVEGGIAIDMAPVGREAETKVGNTQAKKDSKKKGDKKNKN